MGERMRAFDWAATPLGAPSLWSQTLRAAVSLCLAAAGPMALYWGSDYRLLYNDAYAPFLAERHPAALGQPARVIWPEIWASLEAELEQVRTSGRGISRERQPFVLLRFGRPQNTWWTDSLTPITGEEGKVAGLLSTALETTDHIAAERRLQESETYLRLVLDSSVNGLYGIDRSGRTTLCNTAFLRMLGFACEQDVLGTSLHEIIHHSHPDGSHYDGAACPIYAVAQTGKPCHVESELFFRLDGTSFPVEYWVHPILRDGKLHGAVCTFIDISERRAAAEALRESENRFRQIADSAPVPMWVTRLDRKRAFVNRAYVDFLGISYDEAVDFDWRHVIHPDDVKRIYVEQIEKEAALEPFTLEARYRGPNGSWRWLRSESQPRWDADGKHIGFIGVAYDVTVAKRAALELEAANVTLEARVEARTRERDQAWKYSQDLQAVVGANGPILAANQAWHTVLGWEPQEVVGRQYLDFAVNGARDNNAEALKIALDTELPPFETQQRHKDGSTRWISWVAAPAGSIVYASGRNITAEKNAAAALHATQEQLRQSQKMEAVGQLTGGIAHDFNNLLTGITGSLDVLQARLQQGRGAEALRYITAAQNNAARAAALVHRLLAFSRRQTLDSRVLDINHLVTDMRELIGRTAGPAIGMAFHAGIDVWPVFADPNQLENALLNLCINARDAMPDGGDLIIATENLVLDRTAAGGLSLSPGPYVSLTVRDTGTGMTPDIAARAFDPFFTTKPIGQGTGLGLSMIYGFARQSGGQVRIDSTPGQGTTLSLYLPRHEGDLPEAASQAPAEMPGPDAGRGVSVLIVDDEPTIRMLAAEVLEELGYTTAEAADAASARAIIESSVCIDLLITDVGLPGGMNGRQLADLARQLRPGLPVLIITGYAENALVDSAGLAPGMLVLTKPFTMDMLATRIKGLMAG
jgi:PAS domain S-box-containing protein